jgi:hypothetical protein
MQLDRGSVQLFRSANVPYIGRSALFEPIRCFESGGRDSGGVTEVGGVIIGYVNSDTATCI